MHARTRVRDLLESWSLPEITVEELVLIHSELVTNAIQQAPPDPIVVAISWDGDKGISVRVTNTGSATRIPDRHTWHPSSLHAQTGRGLQIVDALSESVEVTATGGEVTVVIGYRSS